MAATVVESTLEKIQSFMNESGYQELTKNTAKFNVRIRKDRTIRQPYIDGQTGVAQRHCNLFVSGKERMPGILQGQVYTYPARRWRATHRSYLATYNQPIRTEPDEHTITSVENPSTIVPNNLPLDENSLGEKPKENWQFFEEHTFDEDMEEDFDSDEDFEDEPYARRSGKRRKNNNKRARAKPTKKRSSSKSTPSKLIRNIKKDENDPDNKPYGCELCGMKYKTRPGLTYHYSHSHKDDGEGEKKEPPPDPSAYTPPVQIPQVAPPIQLNSLASWPESNGLSAAIENGLSLPGRPQRSLHAVTPPLMESLSASPATPVAPSESDKEEKKSVSASPYCDFCLGDSVINKKTGQAEHLVSCADCGRSGHPTCLQFTDNMMKSVIRYRWQCIECKTCTVCGTSENDDQLLFCDDCDRGYHLYCLNPPLEEPPEGEWSCSLCIREFHNNE